MICIFCNSQTEVKNSRPKARTPSIWRRRTCLQCGKQFSTLELPDYEKSLNVTSLNTNNQPFSRDKLFLSIYKSLGHRPDALNSATALTSTIIGRLLTKRHSLQGLTLQNQKDGIISNYSIATISYEVLKRYDPLAAASYKAYHQAALRAAIVNN